MTSKERAELRAQANTLKPVFQIGKEGVTQALADAVNEALSTKELIKLKILLDTAPEKPRELADALAKATDSEVVQLIGGVIVLYKENPELREDKKEKAKKKVQSKPLSKVKAKKAAAERREKLEKAKNAGKKPYARRYGSTK